MNERAVCNAMRLTYAGIYVGPRDPNRNMVFAGAYMVAEDLHTGPTLDASTGGFCIVGDDLAELVNDAAAALLGE